MDSCRGRIPVKAMRRALLHSLLGTLFISTAAVAHLAATGWLYPPECCGDRDCHAVRAADVVETFEGYVVKETGETIAYGDDRVRQSPDGDFHLCIPRSEVSPSAECLFVPPRSF